MDKQRITKLLGADDISVDVIVLCGLLLGQENQEVVNWMSTTKF